MLIGIYRNFVVFFFFWTWKTKSQINYYILVGNSHNTQALEHFYSVMKKKKKSSQENKFFFLIYKYIKKIATIMCGPERSVRG